ncbi:MAG: hypothetical protein SVO01_08815 [Thermotogota bacterium]|nr:hypothetical protein [Thermotogota bacterium]
MGLIARAYRKHNPKGWAIFTDSIKQGNSPRNFSFVAEIGDVNRFASRFRIAKAFRSIDLEDFSNNTTLGYSAIMKVFLSWSAFEQFMNILQMKQKDLNQILKPYEPNKAIRQIKNADRNKSFYNFIYARVNNTHKKYLDKYFDGDLKNITYLASSIRHIFAHGTLTPHSQNTRPEKVIKVCNIISSFLLQVMEEEFYKRVKSPT